MCFLMCLFFDKVDKDFQEGMGDEKRSGDSKMEEPT